MRTKVFFTNVASIEEIRPDGSNVFANIGIAQGGNEQEKLASALQTLKNIPVIDSVVIFPEQGEESLPLDPLRRLSCGRRLKIDTSAENILLDPSWVQNDVHRYLNARMNQLIVNGSPALDMFGRPMGKALPNPYMDGLEGYTEGSVSMNGQDISHAYGWDVGILTDYYTAKTTGIAKGTDARLIRSSLSYSPLYGSSATAEGYINCHVDDEASFDARLIHVSLGSGTVLFNAQDFDVQPGVRNGITVYHPHLIHDDIACLTIPTGSSVVIREPSAAMLSEGRMPSVHSHGIGRTDGKPEERLVERHDLELF